MSLAENNASSFREVVEIAIDQIIPTDRLVLRHDIKRAADHVLVAIANNQTLAWNYLDDESDRQLNAPVPGVDY